MKPMLIAVCLATVWLGPAAVAQTQLELVQATYFGTVGDDDIQGAAPAGDGSFYIVGNTGEPMRRPPGGAAPVRFGADAANPQCGHGFVARISADGMKVLAYAEFAKGIVSVTTVQVNERGVYLAGYATEHLAPLLANVPGFMRQYSLKRNADPRVAWLNLLNNDTDQHQETIARLLREPAATARLTEFQVLTRGQYRPPGAVVEARLHLRQRNRRVTVRRTGVYHLQRL